MQSLNLRSKKLQSLSFFNRRKLWTTSQRKYHPWLREHNLPLPTTLNRQKPFQTPQIGDRSLKQSLSAVSQRARRSSPSWSRRLHKTKSLGSRPTQRQVREVHLRSRKGKIMHTLAQNSRQQMLFLLRSIYQGLSQITRCLRGSRVLRVF